MPKDYYDSKDWSGKHNRDRKDIIAHILTTINDNPGVNQSRVAGHTYTNVHQLNYYIETCLNSGFIRRESSTKGNVKYVLFIEEKGKEYLKYWKSLEEILRL